MATIDSAPWNDGGGGCRNQRAPRISEIQRHKPIEMERSTSVASSNNTSTSSNGDSPASGIPAGIVIEHTETPQVLASTNPFVNAISCNNSHVGQSFDPKERLENLPQNENEHSELTETMDELEFSPRNCDCSSRDLHQIDAELCVGIEKMNLNISLDSETCETTESSSSRCRSCEKGTFNEGDQFGNNIKHLNCRKSLSDTMTTSTSATSSHSKICNRKPQSQMLATASATSPIDSALNVIPCAPLSSSASFSLTPAIVRASESAQISISAPAPLPAPRSFSLASSIHNPSLPLYSSAIEKVSPSPLSKEKRPIAHSALLRLIHPTISNKRILPKTQSLDLADNLGIADNDDINDDADIDDDDDLQIQSSTRGQTEISCLKRDIIRHSNEFDTKIKRCDMLQSSQSLSSNSLFQAQIKSSNLTTISSPASNPNINPTPGRAHIPLVSGPLAMQLQSQIDIQAGNYIAKGMIPKIQSLESRPIYPNVPYSPYGSPYGSPRSNRRRAPLRESRRVSIEQSGSFLQLNQYKLMDQIGQGSYGLVKLAYSEEDSIHYAMKILSKRKLLRKAGLMGRGPKKTTSPLDRVYREIAVLKKLDHPNVVKLIEVLDDPLEDSLYLVFDLVQQGEVLSIPTDRPLSEERAWCVFRDALQGLEYLHYQRIIHADIKPGNLLLGECGRVKIADLGVCNEFFGEDAALNNGSTAGTPAFRAPETLIPGQHLYSGKAADIWALGATLYALVFGNVPFVANSVPAVYEKIKHDELQFPDYPSISSDLRDLIEKILTKDPSKRITLPQIKEHLWVTTNGTYPLPSEEENCRLVQISDEDIHTVVKSIPKLDTLILIKTMLKNHSFQNPFSRGISGRAPQRGGSRIERFTRAGRSNSAPGAYHLSDRQLSNESILPSVCESVPSSCNESSDPSQEGN